MQGDKTKNIEGEENMEKIQHQRNAKSLKSKEKSFKEEVTKTVKFSKKSERT